MDPEIEGAEGIASLGAFVVSSAAGPVRALHGKPGQRGLACASSRIAYAASRAARLAAWTAGSGTGADSMSSRV